MFNPPNALSFLRGPLALLFLFESTTLRLTAVFLAMLTDCADGYLARKYNCASRLGTFLDPIMDKFFVYFVMFVLINDSKLLPWQTSLLISRDFFLCIFGLYLSLAGNWHTCQFRSIVAGKISTALQFVTIILLTLGIALPAYFFWIFAPLGCFVFIELMQKKPSEVA